MLVRNFKHWTLSANYSLSVIQWGAGSSLNLFWYLICLPKNLRRNICFNILWQKIRKFPEKEAKSLAGVSLRNHQVTQGLKSQHPLKTLSQPKRKLTSPVSQSSLCSLLSAYASKLNFNWSDFAAPANCIFLIQEKVWSENNWTKSPKAPITGQGRGPLSAGGTGLDYSEKPWGFALFPGSLLMWRLL